MGSWLSVGKQLLLITAVVSALLACSPSLETTRDGPPQRIEPDLLKLYVFNCGDFQFPSVHFYKEDLNAFTKSYKQKFGAYPTRYATRGFDLTLDLLLRLAAYDSVFEQLTTIQTNYLENKFKYTQGANGGFVNQSAYILKYDNLFIVKVED